MSGAQATFAVIMALIIGYAAGFGSFKMRHPFQQWAGIAEKPGAQEAPAVFVHPIVAEIERARKLRETGKIEEALKLLQEQLLLYPRAPETAEARGMVGEINTELYLGPGSVFGKVPYRVENGDSLSRIARKMKSTPELIMRVNDLESSVIRQGEMLLVPDGKFAIDIDLPAHAVVVRRDGGFFKEYPIQSVKLPRTSQTRLTTSVTTIHAPQKRDGRGGKPGQELEDKPWIQLALGGYTLHGVPESEEDFGDAVEKANRLPNESNASAAGPARGDDLSQRGIGLLTGDLEELLMLISRGTPVTIMREEKRLSHVDAVDEVEVLMG